MGFGSHQAPGQQQSAGALQPRRASLKKQTSRRGLSAFYASKSQSFNCMRDLDNPFCQSTAVMLAKPSSPPSPGCWPSIAEDMCELHTSMTAYQQQQLDEYGDGASPRTAVSAPGSPQHSLMRHSWPGSPAAEDCMADTWMLRGSPSLHQPHHLAEALAAPMPILPTMRCASLGPSLSSSSDGGRSSSVDACEVSLDTTVHDACCFPQLLQEPTDGLCEAMRCKASLAARPAHPVVLLPIAAAFDSL
jgi:hypothetical protein